MRLKERVRVFPVWFAGVIFMAALLLSGCATTEEKTPKAKPEGEGQSTETIEKTGETEKTEAPMVEKEAWEIAIAGTHETTVTAKEFEEAKQHTSHYTDVTLEKKGEKVRYTGMPLWYLMAMVDGKQEEHPYRFDKELWKEGYDITFTASDGYSATVSTSEVAPNDLYFVDQENGEEIDPQIVGDVSKSLWVKNVVRIEASLGGQPSADDQRKSFELTLQINDKKHSYSLSELEKLPYYVENSGSYTTSAGTTHTHTYGGIKLKDVLQRYVELKPDSSIKFVAMDGYEMTYSGKDVLEPGNGEWILAFKRDGEYLPVDPGYIRTIKVGPDTPNIGGHLSVKMVEKIVMKGEGLKDFTLSMKGKMNFDIDRQTLQAGISCHTKTVTFSWKDEENEYTGIPLYLLLSYSDDPDHAPHKQKDTSILAYKSDVAEQGYTVTIVASEGYSIQLDSKELHKNDDVIIAMYKNGSILPEREWPLTVVWDKDAKIVPDGIKPVRNIVSIELTFD